jgi:hypothetical protein
MRPPDWRDVAACSIGEMACSVGVEVLQDPLVLDCRDLRILLVARHVGQPPALSVGEELAVAALSRACSAAEVASQYRL